MKKIEELLNKTEDENMTDEELGQIVELIDTGTIRVASQKDGNWIVDERVKRAILMYFARCEVSNQTVSPFFFRDKIPLKRNFQNVRIVPGGNSVRYGAYLGDKVVMMPPAYVNIGAYVGDGTMIDSNVLVGSCAQIGKNVHLSAGVQIGGVLEPVNALPVIIEDNAFIGAGSLVVEGILVKENAVIGAGVVLSASTKILHINKAGKVVAEFKGEVPRNAIVIPGTRPKGDVSIQTPLIIGFRDEKTSEKVELTEMLRDF